MTQLVSCVAFFFFLMIRRPPRSTLDRSSAASDVYKRQADDIRVVLEGLVAREGGEGGLDEGLGFGVEVRRGSGAVSYTHLRAHETVLDLVCRLLLETKKKNKQ